MTTLRIKTDDENLLWTRNHDTDTGMDVKANGDYTIPAKGKVIIDTGTALGIPAGYWVRLEPRSGLAAKHSIHVGAGVIDVDYKGIVKVVMFNLGDEDFEVKKYDRIAQARLTRLELCDIELVDSLEDSSRGEKGLGSSGVK